jgi:signal transduction histidine kinase
MGAPDLNASSAALAEALGRAEDDLASLLLFLNAAPVALLELDDDGSIRLANSSAARLLAPLATGLGLDNLFTLLVPALPPDVLPQAVAARGARPGSVCTDLRIHVTPPNGEPQVLSLRIDRLAERRLLATLADITAQVQAERAQAVAAAQADESRRLHQLSQLKSRFLATMSHELRTPLTTVLGFVELLRRGRLEPGTPKGADVMARIANNGSHLLRLIDDVLDLAYIEAGTLELRPALLDLRPLVAEVVEALAPQSRAKGLTVTVAVQDGLDALMLDPTRLRQMLWHLVSNAVKFTPLGGAVALQAQPLPEADGPPAFELSVRDTGIGIALAHQPLAFERFHQLDGGNGRLQEGAGLGLTLTRELARAHLGELLLHSAPGQGSTLTLRLPMVLGPVDEPA